MQKRMKLLLLCLCLMEMLAWEKLLYDEVKKKKKAYEMDLRSEEQEPPFYLNTIHRPPIDVSSAQNLPTKEKLSTSQPTIQAVPHSHESTIPTKEFTYEEVAAATDDFSRANSIGMGAFSKNIYRAEILTGRQVTVKKFAENNESGFLSEMLAISRTNHPNIVKMIGYCVHEATRMLILEYIPNNTLDFHLYGGRTPAISWRNRMKIALEVAKGLAYLHEDCDPIIIHRNMKSSNILLDFDFEPKIAGFDFAINIKNYVSRTATRDILATSHGYMYPDYCLDNKHFDKSDVFSFGLILLGLVTGTKPSSYVEEAKRMLPLLKKVLLKNKYDDIADPALGNEYAEEEMSRMIRCAASCIYKPEKSRPQMNQIVEALKGDLSMEFIWEDKNDWRYDLHPLDQVDRPILQQIWDEEK